MAKDVQALFNEGTKIQQGRAEIFFPENFFLFSGRIYYAIILLKKIKAQ